MSRARLVEGDRYPDPPVNVRLCFADGMVVPVDCTYVGWDREEQAHLWAAINPRPSELPVDMLIDRLPANTSIAVGGVLDGE